MPVIGNGSGGGGGGDFLADGSVPMTGDLDLGGNDLSNGGVGSGASPIVDVYASGSVYLQGSSTSSVIAADATGFSLTIQPGGGSVSTFNNAGNLNLQSQTFNGATKLQADAAGQLAQRNGTNAQAFHVYNTYTDSSNYERGFMRWSANTLEVGTEAAGTGTSRALAITGNNVFIRDEAATVAAFYSTALRCYVPTTPVGPASTDLGESAVPWRNIYLRPSASLTPTNNGDLTIEATNDTTITFKLKGSDGTVRSGTITLS